MEFKFNDKAVKPHLEAIASLEIDRHFINKDQQEDSFDRQVDYYTRYISSNSKWFLIIRKAPP